MKGFKEENTIFMSLQMFHNKQLSRYLMLYSLIFLLIRSWLVTAAFCNNEEGINGCTPTFLTRFLRNFYQ